LVLPLLAALALPIAKGQLTLIQVPEFQHQSKLALSKSKHRLKTETLLIQRKPWLEAILEARRNQMIFRAPSSF
jgi:hypothetical protein